MGKELLGVKVNPETKERISELIEQAKAAGMIEDKGDIFDLFVERFQQDELSKKLSYGADLKELQQITRRINEIFINLADRNETNINDLQRQHETIMATVQEDVLKLKEERKQLEQELTSRSDEISELTDTLTTAQERVKELEDIQQGYIERIEEQKANLKEKDEKLASKNELISEKEEAISAMKDDITKSNQLKEEINQLQIDIDQLQQTIITNEEDLKKQKENMEFECQKRIFAREQELEKERGLELKKIQDDLRKEVTRYQDKYEKVLVEKDKLLSAHYELQTTIERERIEMERKDSLISSKDKEISDLKERINEWEENQ